MTEITIGFEFGARPLYWRSQEIPAYLNANESFRASTTEQEEFASLGRSLVSSNSGKLILGTCVDIASTLARDLDVKINLVEYPSMATEKWYSLLENGTIDIIGKLVRFTENDEWAGFHRLGIMHTELIAIGKQGVNSSLLEWLAFWKIYSWQVWGLWLLVILISGSVLYFDHSNWYYYQRLKGNFQFRLERYDSDATTLSKFYDVLNDCGMAAGLALGSGNNRVYLQSTAKSRILCTMLILFGTIYWTYAMSRLLSLYTTSEYALPFYSFSQIAEKGLGITFFAGGSTSAIMMNSSDSVIRKLVNESLEKGAAVRNNTDFLHHINSNSAAGLIDTDRFAANKAYLEMHRAFGISSLARGWLIRENHTLKNEISETIFRMRSSGLVGIFVKRNRRDLGLDAIEMSRRRYLRQMKSRHIITWEKTASWFFTIIVGVMISVVVFSAESVVVREMGDGFLPYTVFRGKHSMENAVNIVEYKPHKPYETEQNS